MSFASDLIAAFGEARVQRDAPLGPLTTFKVGGPADWLVDARTTDEVLAALRIAHASGTPVTLLGGGSNVLVGDGGVRGLVLRPRTSAIGVEDGCVRADAGLTINGLVRWTINRGLGGVEAWAGTPGVIGGAVYGNAHYGGRLIGDVIESVRMSDRRGVVSDVAKVDMGFGYDCSRVQITNEVVLSVRFRVSEHEPAAALRDVARRSLAHRKQTQPLDTPSAGCVFQNPDPAAARPTGLPPSAGALVDHAGLKGHACGRARVSPVHANFIVNDGGATAREIDALIQRCKEAVRARFGVVLHEEIVRVGEFS